MKRKSFGMGDDTHLVGRKRVGNVVIVPKSPDKERLAKLEKLVSNMRRATNV